MILKVMRGQAQNRTWDDLADNLTPSVVGKTLVALHLFQRHTKHNQFYSITLPQLERLIDAYRLNLPPVLEAYPRFAKDTLLATLPPDSPGAPLQPPSLALQALIAKRFGPLPPPL